MTLDEWRAKYVGKVIALTRRRDHPTMEVGICTKIEDCPFDDGEIFVWWQGLNSTHPQRYYIDKENRPEKWHVHLYGESLEH